MAEETTILDAGNVTVTTRRIVIGNQMYPVAGINSVRLEREQPGLGKPFLLAIVGAVVAVGNAVLGMMIIAGAIAWPFIASKPYQIRIGTAGGEVVALTTPQQEEAQTILGAISKAITA